MLSHAAHFWRQASAMDPRQLLVDGLRNIHRWTGAALSRPRISDTSMSGVRAFELARALVHQRRRTYPFL